MWFLLPVLVVIATVGSIPTVLAKASQEGALSARPVIVAHRGSTTTQPENTLAAFAWAEQAGADAIEVDLRVSADDQIVIIHDWTVDRTTDGRGQVHRLSLAELQSLDAGNGQRLPTLSETLEFIQPLDLRLLLDIKDSRRINVIEMVREIERFQMTDRVVVGSRSIELLDMVKAVQPRLTIMGFVPQPRQIDEFVAHDVDIVRLWANWTAHRPQLVSEIQSMGPEVWITTGKRRDQRLEDVIFQGADGVITDFPGYVRNMPLGDEVVTLNH